MSWSFAVSNVGGADLEEALENAAEEAMKTHTYAPQESVEQMMAACAAAAEFVHTGAVGLGPYVVRLHGHANPGHIKPPGWSQSAITVTVEQFVPLTGQG